MITRDNASIDNYSHARLRLISIVLFMAPWLLHISQMLVANVLSGALAIMVCLLLHRSGCRLSRNAWIVCGFLCVLMLVSLISSPLLSALGMYAWLRGGIIFSMVLMFCLVADFFKRYADAVHHFAVAAVLSAALYSVMLGLFMVAIDDLSLWDWWASPPFGIHLRLVSYGLMPAAIAAVWLFFHTSEVFQRIMLFLALTLIFAVQLWSGGRAGLIAMVLGVAVLGCCYRGVSHHRSWQLIALSALLAFWLSQAVATDQPGMGWWHALERTGQAESMNQMSSRRLLLWQMVWPYVEQRFMVGWGGEAFLYLWERTPGAWPQFQPHNGWLQLHLEWGLLFAIIIWGAILTILLAAIRVLVDCESDSLTDSGILIFGVALTVSWLFMSVVDGVAYHGMSMFYFTLSCACLYAGLLMRKRSSIQLSRCKR